MLFCLSVSVLTIVQHVLLHWDTYVTALGLVLWAIRATKWGKANAKALQTLAGAVERLGSAEVKAAVREDAKNLPRSVIKAIDIAVNTVDPKKPTPTGSDVLAGEVKQTLRDIVPVPGKE